MVDSHQPVPAREPASPVAAPQDAGARRRFVRSAWTNAVLAASLVLSLLLTLDYAVAWAVGGLMHVGNAAIWAAAGLGAVACIWVSIRFFRSALKNELDLTLPHQGA